MLIMKKNYNISKFVCLLVFVLTLNISITTSARAQNYEDALKGPWSSMFYFGGTSNEVFIDAIIGKYSSFGENIYAFELAYILDRENLFRSIFSFFFDTVEIAGNVAFRHDFRRGDNVKEANLYLIWRFAKFPWRDYLRTTIGFGDGISHASHIPFADREAGETIENHSRTLNYLMLELTFALPKYPNLELLIRTHHRCTAWGTFAGNPNAGSTNVGFGLRYHF